MAQEDLLLNAPNGITIGKREEQAKGHEENRDTPPPPPKSIRLQAKQHIILQKHIEEFVLIGGERVAIRGKKIDFEKVELPFAELVDEEELKDLYVEELIEEGSEEAMKVRNILWSEKQKENYEQERPTLYSVNVTEDEVRTALRAKVASDPQAVQKAKTLLVQKDSRELQQKYLSLGKPETPKKAKKKSEGELEQQRSSYVTQYVQTNRLMTSKQQLANAKTAREWQAADATYREALEALNPSGEAGKYVEPEKYYSKQVSEMMYYSRFNFERIVIASQYGEAFMNIAFGVMGLVAVAASVTSAGTSVLVWSLLVGDAIVSGGQTYLGVVKMNDLGEGYAYTDPEIAGVSMSDLDKVGLLIAAVNLGILVKHGAKMIDAGLNAKRMQQLEEALEAQGIREWEVYVGRKMPEKAGSGIEGTGNTLNRIDSGSGHIPMNAEKFDKMKNAFEKHGGLIVKEEEALPLLNYHGVEASTLDATTIAFRPNPSTSAVFEEFIHATQYRTGRANGTNIIEMEIEAKEKLIKFRNAYGIPNSETRDTIQQLREYRQMLEK
ncbi:hypothetical protein [Paenibacillus senegalimassiliensis]|uniref:hypothetical protein n=1 Tax=Paenibacillus senegalimassiliensis TaxID=1737426 RepID=UPI0011DCE211|nr:hypothetical protein [Paenibacillus senegalimassiliensis]